MYFWVFICIQRTESIALHSPEQMHVNCGNDWAKLNVSFARQLIVNYGQCSKIIRSRNHLSAIVHGKQFLFRDATSATVIPTRRIGSSSSRAPPVLLFSSASVRDITISIGSVVGVRLTPFVERIHANSINITAETQVHAYLCH